MLNKKVTLMLALLVIAVFAIGSVSASDDIATDSDVPTDDITVDDVSVDGTGESGKVVEPTRGPRYVNNSMTNLQINQQISGASSDTNGNHVVNFANQTYTGASFTLQNDVILDGHGATLIGDGTNDIFLVTGKSNFTIKNFIINVNNNVSGHGIYGHHVYNSTITNNTIFNCSDAINIYQIHENLTITDNTIYDFTGDGISLVNFQNYMNDDDGFAAFVGSTISGNNITGGEYGMFFGGNFKGTITGNNITGSTYGMQFKGKKSASNGRLDAVISDNILCGVTVGIDMNNPCVDFLDISYNIICTVNNTGFVIANNTNFAKSTYGLIFVEYNTFYGLVRNSFVNQTDSFTPNYGNYTIIYP